MALRIQVQEGALLFKSVHYFLVVGKYRMTLPAWLTPGALTVTHKAIDDEYFEFVLDVVHPAFGQLIHQSAVFKEATT